MTQTSKSVATLMQESGVAFGTSGARGLVTAMTEPATPEQEADPHD